MIRPSKKPLKNGAMTQTKKTLQKKHPKVDFDVHFGAPKPPEMAPKSRRDAKKLGLERSLFYDAMEPAPASAQVNWAQRL